MVDITHKKNILFVLTTINIYVYDLYMYKKKGNNMNDVLNKEEIKKLNQLGKSIRLSLDLKKTDLI